MGHHFVEVPVGWLLQHKENKTKHMDQKWAITIINSQVFPSGIILFFPPKQRDKDAVAKRWV